MFKSITSRTSLYSKPTYRVEDTDFACEISVCPGAPSLATERLAALCIAYNIHKRPLTRNVVLFYLKLAYENACFGENPCIGEPWLKMDKTWIDRYYPELNYGSKYYPCVIKHLNKLKLVKYNNA